MINLNNNFKSRREIRESISKNIKKYRTLKHLTQEELAEYLNLSYDFVKRLEFKKGEVGCSIYTLYKIAIVLETRIDNFFE